MPRDTVHSKLLSAVVVVSLRGAVGRAVVVSHRCHSALQGHKWQFVHGCSPWRQRSPALPPAGANRDNIGGTAASPPSCGRRTAHRDTAAPTTCACGQLWPRSADGHHGSCRTCACTRALSCFACRPPTNFVTCLFPNVHADCRRTPAPNATSIELPTPHGRWLFAPLEPAKPDKSQRQGPC